MYERAHPPGRLFSPHSLTGMSAYSLTITTTLADSDVGEVETARAFSDTYISPGAIRLEELVFALKGAYLDTFGRGDHGLSHTWGESFYTAMQQDLSRKANWRIDALIRDMETTFPAFYLRIDFEKVETSPDPISDLYEQSLSMWGHSK